MPEASDVPNNGGEPVLEGESFAAVTTVFAILRQLEEPQIDPGNKEAKLDQDEGRRAEDDDKNVGNKEVDSWNGLPEVSTTVLVSMNAP